MAHTCDLNEDKQLKTGYQKFKEKLWAYILISSSNPLRLSYFKSELLIRQEQQRHLQTNPYVIHPFSTFRGRYEIFLIILYLMALLLKPMNAFIRPTDFDTMCAFLWVCMLGNVMCWFDIVMTFFTGFSRNVKDSTVIELRFSKIASNYMLGPYFVCDMLSSFPKEIFYFPGPARATQSYFIFRFFTDVFVFFKFVRIVPLFVYIYRTARYLEVKSKLGPFLVCTSITTALIVHWSACLQFGIPKMTMSAFSSSERLNKSWIRIILDEPVPTKYNYAFFKSSAYILGIRHILYRLELPEEYMVALLTYFIGKILVAYVWLILAITILNSRSVDIKFLELINQLEEYMKRKMLPLNLRRRISEYYHFTFQKKYFKTDFINDTLSGTIKKDITMHVCNTMIKNVSLFSDLTYEEISNIVENLVPEIFLPQDTIIQHGTYGESMYFLSTGTVAVYTRSGKEICHLQDGAYFGEISLILPDQTRNASIIAIETSLVYRLDKYNFDRFLLKNVKTRDKIMRCAEEKLIQATLIEDSYKKHMFEQSYKAT